jgi:cytoskeletal protein RodZ
VLIAGWALATVLALLLGLQSVSAISNSVTNHRKASLSPASVKAALNRSTSSPSSSSSSESTESSDPASSSESTPPPAPASASSSSEDGGPASTGPGVVDEHSNPPTENGSQGEGASSDSSAQEHDSSSSTSPAPAPEDRTYQLVGGSVGVHFENGAARLLWATPNTGFSVESSGPGSQVDVRFLSDSHESRLRAFWENGPGQEIEEDDR